MFKMFNVKELAQQVKAYNVGNKITIEDMEIVYNLIVCKTTEATKQLMNAILVELSKELSPRSIQQLERIMLMSIKLNDTSLPQKTITLVNAQ